MFISKQTKIDARSEKSEGLFVLYIRLFYLREARLGKAKKQHRLIHKLCSFYSYLNDKCLEQHSAVILSSKLNLLLLFSLCICCRGYSIDILNLIQGSLFQLNIKYTQYAHGDTQRAKCYKHNDT